MTTIKNNRCISATVWLIVIKFGTVMQMSSLDITELQDGRRSPYCEHTHTHNHFTALLEYVRDHPGEQVPER